MLYQETFHLKLKKARQDAGYTQAQTSNETGIPRSTLANYERGRTQPDIETLGILAHFYNVSIDWLVGINIVPPLHVPNKKSSPKERDSL